MQADIYVASLELILIFNRVPLCHYLMQCTWLCFKARENFSEAVSTYPNLLIENDWHFHVVQCHGFGLTRRNCPAAF